MKVYIFDGSTYTGSNVTTNESGQVMFTLSVGDYRFRVDKADAGASSGTQFWNGSTDANHCTVPGCTGATATTTVPVVVSVRDTDGNAEIGLPVYAFSGTTYSGYHGTTDAGGWTTFTLPQGDYRFRADKNGTHFWSGAANHCAVPGCTATTVTTTVPVVVTVADGGDNPEPNLPVYAFDESTYSGYHGATGVSGTVTLTLPQGNYRFRADKDGTHFWSGAENTCTVPGCVSDTVTTTAQARLGRGKTFAVPLPVLTVPAPRRDNAAGIRVTRTITYTYDPLSRLTAADYSTGEHYAYTYDAVGNRTAMTDTSGIHTYTYDAANRLTSVDGVTYTWDARGNLTYDGVFTYTYNTAGRMVRAQSVTSTLVYTYTASGLRVTQNSAGAVTTFVWDWAQGVPEMLGDGNTLYLVGHATLGWVAADAWTFVLPDALGSVRQEVDATGAVTAAREWSPYGVAVGGARAGLGFTGEWQVAFIDTGLVYLRARWYSPKVGRFLSPDSAIPGYQNPQSFNRYVYVENNPLKYIDPSGFEKYIILYGNYPETDAFQATAETQKQMALTAGYIESDILLKMISFDEQILDAISQSSIGEIEYLYVFSHGWPEGLQLMAYHRSDAFDQPFFQFCSDDLGVSLDDRFAEDAEIHIKACEVGSNVFAQQIADRFGTLTYASLKSMKFWHLQEARYIPQGPSSRIEWVDVALGEETVGPTRWRTYDGTPQNSKESLHVEMFPYIFGRIDRLGIDLTLRDPGAYRRFTPN